MMVTSGIRHMIREGKTYHLAKEIDTTQNVGTRSIEEDIGTLYSTGLNDPRDAITRALGVDRLFKLTGAEVLAVGAFDSALANPDRMEETTADSFLPALLAPLLP